MFNQENDGFLKQLLIEFNKLWDGLLSRRFMSILGKVAEQQWGFINNKLCQRLEQEDALDSGLWISDTFF